MNTNIAIFLLGLGFQIEGYKPKESIEDRKKRLANAQVKIYKKQGLTEFFYGKNSLWALNKNSADRKARKLHYL